MSQKSREKADSVDSILTHSSNGKVLPESEINIKPLLIQPAWMKWHDHIKNFEINDDLHKRLVFRETLLISRFENQSRTSPTPIGGLCLDIQSARGDPQHTKSKIHRNEFKTHKFLVHLSSRFDYFGGKGGSTITAWVDRRLHTLEEQRHEYLKHEAVKNEQRLYLSSQEKNYYLRHNKRTEKNYTPEEARNLVEEGASFILMRYLAITRFIGEFEVATTYINGDLCRNIYNCEGPSSGIINDTRLDVCKIYRTIIEQCGITHASVTLLTLQGQILKHEWSEASIILQINPLAKLHNSQVNDPEKLRPDPKQDIELLSRYLDAKTLSEKTIESYMDDYKQIRNLMADYVQLILQLKPDNVLDFTAQYFMSFAPELLELTKNEEMVNDEENDDFYV